MARPLLIVLLALVVAPGCSSESGNEASPAGTTTAQLVSAAGPEPVVERCSSRSEAEFGGAFEDPANLVSGPLVLVGAGEPQSAAVVEAHGGQKFPLLVRAGHTVTVEVPAEARERVRLGYGLMPQGKIHFVDGHPAVRFRACPLGGPSSSTAGPGEPVTFWSGAVLVSEPTCAPLDIVADGETAPRRREIELGAAC